jgi:curved DNA-binding protein CbpA
MSLELRKSTRINTLYEIVDDLDYYQLLKKKTDCTQNSIAPAFQLQSKELHPDNAPAALKDKANYIFTAINEAFRILKDPQNRLEYDGLLSNGVIRVEDTALRSGAERSSTNDPSKAAQTEQSKKYWLMGLADMDAERYDSAIMNIKFAIQFERSNEVFQEWLAKAQQAAQEAPQKEKNPFKIRL